MLPPLPVLLLLILFFASHNLSGREFSSSLLCEERYLQLERDLKTISCIDKRLNDRFPVNYNYWLQSGYIVMPSARVTEEGMLSLSYSSLPPYTSYNARFQILNWLEITGNYRIFTNIEDMILSKHGFGDKSDKGMGIKITLLKPEDSYYSLPGIAIGADDILGTRQFASKYLVATQVFRESGLEVSIGCGGDRLHGLFGGAVWMPWRNSSNSLLAGIGLIGEYDATEYKDPRKEHHPDGRVQRCPWNLGVNCRLWESLDLSCSYIRGDAFAFSAATSSNVSEFEGFVTKIDEPQRYRAPVNFQPIGPLRSEREMMDRFVFALNEQGFNVLEGRLVSQSCCDIGLRLRLTTSHYRYEPEVRCQLSSIFAALTPANIREVVAVIESEGFPVQEYHFDRRVLNNFQKKRMGEFELMVLSPLQEASPICSPSKVLYKERRPFYCISAAPRFQSSFGSAKGKFNYNIGIGLGVSGYLWNNIYYDIEIGSSVLSTYDRISDADMLNPSQLINVRSDGVNYSQGKDIKLDNAFLQRGWNLGAGWYGRVAGGYLEKAYGGVAIETLYYPVYSPWAFGLEYASLMKRQYRGLGFTSKTRHLDGWTAYQERFKPHQFFFDIYYDWRLAGLDLKLSLGQFLARDLGARTEITRRFENGFTFSLWYTVTSGKDYINGKRYHDKGFEIGVPLDIFLEHSCRKRWHYGLSAWLRDVGARASTGHGLYDLIRDERFSL